MNQSNAVKSDLILVVVTLLAAAGWIFSKESLSEIPPLMFIGLRFLIAGLVLALFGWQALRSLDRRGILRTALVGVSFGVAMIFWILGLHHAQHIGVGAFLSCLGAVIVPIVSTLFGERANRAVWLSLPLAAIGLACLSLDSQFIMGWGELSFLCSAVFFAFTFVLNSRAAAKTSPIALAAVQLMVVGLVALPVSLATETWSFDWPGSIWMWMLASIFIATSVRFFMQTWAQSLSSASNAAVIMTLEPIWTAMLAALWFGETMTGLQLGGCALIFCALLVSRWRSVRQAIRVLIK
ncbi:DMT family transporter [Neptunomonas antarctica]|uniref:Threonine/homoserine efflux transporter RhtA n=1 Tax=Neptunomonas antarctica TaxID=619304 RepID=A0A1N7IY81_9GAMM|nr:DMT family transporter [Neptunomonas antarctica]SIS42072.1 Threonine/homoserine efflux transporter RhtA [Neptunomonas antarctica]